MSDHFVCRFAVGGNGLAYSGVWRVWTARKKPDLYIAVEKISGQMKATVHCPRPPHNGWKRHYGFPLEASGPVAQAAKRDSGPHQCEWTGCPIGPDCTLEYRVVIFGKSLARAGNVVRADTVLLPAPTEQQAVEVLVVLGPNTPIAIDGGFPRDSSAPTSLLSEGVLSDGRRVWVVYCTRQFEIKDEPAAASTPIAPAKSYVDKDADFSKNSLRAVVYGPQEDGHLAFWDKRVDYVGPG
jgi:hypothetical protein